MIAFQATCGWRGCSGWKACWPAMCCSWRCLRSTSTAIALVAAVAGFMAYTAWIMRRIWLNAPNVERAELGTMARVLTIGWTINAVTVCTFLVLAKLGGQPLQFLG